MREYGRTVTTAVSAVVGPAMAAYLARLDDALRTLGLDCPVHVMESSGGVMPTASAQRRAAHTVESGPAAGVVATQALGRTLGVADLLSFDMGGTTAKCGVVRDGTAERQPEFYVGGGASGPDRHIGRYVIRMPAIALAEVGSGGGSIAWLDRAGALRVGPRSAGADPGPACYGLGGTRPTVTDANLLLGYLDADRFAGGTMRLSVDAAAAAVERDIAGPLGITVLEAAAAIHGFVNASMAAAVRMTTIQRGLDPRDFTLVGFGGSGPVHAVGLAATFDIARVVVPRQAGVRSAVGLLDTDLSTDQIQGCLQSLVDGDPAVVDATFAALEARARSELSAGADDPAVRVARSADVRYHGQAHHLVVPVDPGPIDARAAGAIVARFEADYERTYGVRITGVPELVHCRVRAERTVHRAEDPSLAAGDRRAATPSGSRQAWFDATGPVEVPTYDWTALTPGLEVAGPAVIDGPDSSLVVPPAAVCGCDPHGNLVVDLSVG
jgi:N-methylhydantoinase A